MRIQPAVGCSRPIAAWPAGPSLRPSFSWLPYRRAGGDLGSCLDTAGSSAIISRIRARQQLLLTDGKKFSSKMRQHDQRSPRETLTQDNTSSYVNGSSTQVHVTRAVRQQSRCPQATIYAPLFHASALLADGRFCMIVERRMRLSYSFLVNSGARSGPTRALYVRSNHESDGRVSRHRANRPKSATPSRSIMTEQGPPCSRTRSATRSLPFEHRHEPSHSFDRYPLRPPAKERSLIMMKIDRSCCRMATVFTLDRSGNYFRQRYSGA